MSDAGELIARSLTSEEKGLLRRGLLEWGGPARCTEELAVAMGFASVAALLRDGRGLARAIEEGRPLSRRDWSRAMVATEVVFISDAIGSGRDWCSTTGLDDTSTLKLLRELQLKLRPDVVSPGPAEGGTR